MLRSFYESSMICCLLSCTNSLVHVILL
uniref:Uncharacterized protein n=1 Tax=Arundo donax TaxID=35708 RepID=A0A0A8XP53_ARUDO